jgi:hypothetical protein
VKKTCRAYILLIIMMIVTASCSSAPKNQKTDVPEATESEVPLPPPAEEQPPLAESPPPEIPEEIVEADIIIEEIEEVADEEPVLAEEEPPAEIVEPEPPVVAVAPEPEPPRTAEPPVEPPAAPPPVMSVPRQEPPRITTPPPVTARPTPPVAPPTPPPVSPPVEEEKPPVKEEPPAIVREPLPRDGPELPYPTPGFSGRQDAMPPMVFSRVVRATVGQLVEIPFRGTGWVYLGEAGAQRGIAYDSRRLDSEGQSFIFRTERAGEYALKFYRQDFIRDFIINDYVQVIVGAPAETAGTGWFSPPVDRGRVIAEPRWPSPLTEAQALRADSRPAQPDTPAAPTASAEKSTVGAPASAAPVQPQQTVQPARPSTTPPVTSPPASSVTPTVPSTPSPVTPSVTPPVTSPPVSPDTSKNAAPELPVYVDPAEYLEKAQEEFAAGRVASAISFLDQFCQQYPSGTDETWWLYGQFYEANSPSRNILAALNCYRHLVQEYPQSSRFDDARKRIAYLQRYYININ